MDKAMVSRCFGGGLALVGIGLLIVISMGFGAGASGGFVTRGPDVVGIDFGAPGGALGVAMLAGVAIACAGALGLFVAWVAAMANTLQSGNPAWFAGMVLLSVLSFGFLALVAYVVAGPDPLLPERSW